MIWGIRGDPISRTTTNSQTTTKVLQLLLIKRAFCVNGDFRRRGGLQRYATRGLMGSISLATRRIGTMEARDEGTSCSLSTFSNISSSLGSAILCCRAMVGCRATVACRATLLEGDLKGASLLPLELAIYESSRKAIDEKKLQILLLLVDVVQVREQMGGLER